MQESFEALLKLARIFFLVNKLYTINCYFRWPSILGDKGIVFRLYGIVLSTMHRIQTKLFEVMPIEYHNHISLMQLLIADTTSLNIPYFRDLSKFFSSHNMEKEFEPVMNFLWKLGFDLIDMPSSFKIKTNEQDWKSILAT